MTKTTVYLPKKLKSALARTAAEAGISEAEVIRRAIEHVTAGSVGPRPTVPLFRSAVPDLSERVDESLAGFGER